MHIKFWVISFNRSRNITIQKFWKKCDCSSPYQAMSSKIMSTLSFEVRALHAKIFTSPWNRIQDKLFIRFHYNISFKKFYKIPCNRSRDMTFKSILWKMQYKRPLQSYLYPQCVIFISNNICFLYIFLCFSSSRNWDQRTPKILEKVWLQWHLLTDFH